MRSDTGSRRARLIASAAAAALLAGGLALIGAGHRNADRPEVRLIACGGFEKASG